MNYKTRPATNEDYQYCYRLTKNNMLELFTRHWGGWVSSAFRNGFETETVTIVMYHGHRVGYFSIKEYEEYLFHPSPFYERTRDFYQAMGFRPLEEFVQLWGQDNPCLLIIKYLHL